MFGDIELLAGKQHAVVRLHHAEQNLLIRALKLMRRRGVHFLRTADPMPGSERVEQIPGASKARREIAVGRGSVQFVQRRREVVCREALLAQFAAEHIHGIVAPGGQFGKTHMRHEKRLRFSHSGPCCLAVRQSGLSQWILLQGNAGRLRQREDGGVRRCLCVYRTRSAKDDRS